MKRLPSLFRWPMMTWVLLLFFAAAVVFSVIQLSAEIPVIQGDMVQQALQRGKPTIAEFGSDSCSSCKKMTQVLQQLEHRYGDKLAVVQVNIIRQPDYVSRYRIMLIPTQVFYDAQGQETGRHMGVLTEQELLHALGIAAGGS